MNKRPHRGQLVPAAKKPRLAANSVVLRDDRPATGTSLARIDQKSGAKRTSSLLAPTMQLTGHNAKIFTCRFSRDGKHLASGGVDKDIFLWYVKGECQNHTMLRGHKNAVMQVQWSKDSSMVFSASADQTAAVWDAEAAVRVRKLREHSSFVNGVSPSLQGMQLLATASDDGTAKVFDIRMKTSVKTYDAMYQCTAACFDRYTTELFTGGIDNVIKIWDLRKSGETPKYILEGHLETITDLKLNPEGTHLLSSAMDNTARCWDMRPFVKGSRAIAIYDGVHHDNQKNLIRANWSPDGRMICSGSADGMVYVWDEASGEILYQLPGHKGVVNEVDFHPLEPIILSGSADKLLYLGEL